MGVFIRSFTAVIRERGADPPEGKQMNVTFSSGELEVVKKLLTAEEKQAKDDNYKTILKAILKRIARALGDEL